MSETKPTRAKPRYLELADLMEREIGEGVYTVGGMMPTEQELCERFSVSRHTVREALRRMHDMGLVERRQGVGHHRTGTAGVGDLRADAAFAERHAAIPA